MMDALILAREAQLSAQVSLSVAASCVDEIFPEHPLDLKASLIAALVTAIASHEVAANLRLQAEETAEAARIVARSIWGLEPSLRSDHPLMGETLEEVAAGLRSIARSIGERQPTKG
jgi:hypothetical protein